MAMTQLETAASAPDVVRHRVRLLLALGILLVIVMFLVPRIPQDPGYHNFADQRTCLGVPNCLNVASNLPFLVVGILGFLFLVRDRAAGATDAFITPAERQPYWALFAGVGLTGIGSAYYHWAPDNSTLFWDRLPMTIAFMGILSSVIAERINLKVGLRLLWPLVVIGALSTLYWHMGELRGVGDLRPYALVQFGTMAAIPLILWLFPPRYTRTVDMAWVIGWYALAKVFEFFDHGFFHVTGVSGHTLKHLASAVGAWWILRMLQRRRPLPRAA
jgi:hypothetical protein